MEWRCDSLVSVQHCKGINEREVAGNLLKLGMGDEAIFVMVVVLEDSLHHVVDVFVDCVGVWWTDACHPVSKHHRLGGCGGLAGRDRVMEEHKVSFVCTIYASAEMLITNGSGIPIVWLHKKPPHKRCFQ